MQRNYYRDMKERTVQGMVSAQATSKDVKKYVKKLSALAGDERMKDGNDLKAALGGKGGI